MRGWFKSCGRAKILLGFWIVRAVEHQAEVEIRFKNIRLGGNRFAISGDGFICAIEAIENESEIEPCLIRPALFIVGIFIEHLFQQRFGRSEIIFLDGVFCLRDFRWCVVDALPCNGGW